jgi:hypothetical protein
MKKILITFASSLLFFSLNVFADPHIDEAVKHASAAAEGGDAAKVVEHAIPALEHAMTSALTAKGLKKTHTEAAIKALETAIDQGKNNKTDAASASAQAAIEHLNAANKS